MMWGYGHDWGMTSGWGGGAFSMIIWPLVIVALVVGVIWLMRSPSYSGAGRLQLPRRSSGLDILEERFDGHARVLEQPSAADFPQDPLDSGALRPVDHHHKVVKFSRKSKQSDAAPPPAPPFCGGPATSTTSILGFVSFSCGWRRSKQTVASGCY